MAGDNRKVDSGVLRDLATATREKRDRLDSIYRECRSRVDAAPRRWSTGEWDGTVTFMRLELEQLGKERQELVDRALVVDVAAALAALPNPLSTWRALLKLFQPASTRPNRPWTEQDQALFERARMIAGIAKKAGYKLTQNEFLKLRDGSLGEKELGIAVSGLMVTSVVKRAGFVPTQVQLAQLTNSGLDLKGVEAKVRTLKALAGFLGEPLNSEGKSGGQCVAFARSWATQLDGTDTSFAGGPNGTPKTEWDAWSSQSGRFTSQHWNRIPSGPFQRGDIIFFGGTTKLPAHVGIVASDWNGQGDILITDSNYGNNELIRQDHLSGRIGTLLGVMRHKFDAQQAL